MGADMEFHADHQRVSSMRNVSNSQLVHYSQTLRQILKDYTLAGIPVIPHITKESEIAQVSTQADEED